MSFYYLVCLLKSPLEPLTYKSDTPLHVGVKVEVTLQKRLCFGVVLKEVEKPSFTCEDILSVFDETYDKTTLELARFIAEYYVCSLGEALALFTTLPSYVLAKNPDFKIDIKLSCEQKEAYDFALQRSASLLFGDTGSGKSEIYMKLFEKAIQEGKSSLFLLPEIGLTPQMKSRLKHHFGDKVVVWHSKITKKKKDEIVQDIADGKVYIVAGTRSALFLPLSNLGLIVVDEEHDDSYKSSSRPRYNARDLALLFGQKTHSRVLLGSATPSLSSFYKIPYARLKGTYFDSKSAFFYENSHNELTPLVLQKLEEVLSKGKQAVIFLPTRANFKYITCSKCGKNVECPYCSVGMSLHLKSNALKCHYCNFAMRIPSVCPECGCEDIVANRIGTAEVAKLLSEYFPEKSIQKFDRDEVTTDGKLKSILERFNTNQIDVLVGTQMISKGHDYHNVALAVVMGMDSQLAQSDFRAREKALSLTLQIAGRAGRKGYAEVLIQSKNEAFFKYYIKNYEEFLKDELQNRTDLYPPFKKLLRIVIVNLKEEKAKAIADEIFERSQLFPKVEIIGYGRANIQKIAGKYRYEVLVRADSTKALLEFAHSIKGLHVEFDIDPLSFS
ncbi:MAG: primosomal protein N' [Sulfurospirillaceae bacterium]|nr:primosomal protein N' [Sulfurospirillaceae bacterium]